MPGTPSAQYTLTLRVTIPDRPGMLGKVAGAIGDAGATIGAVDLVEVREATMVRDITVLTASADDWPRLRAAVDAVPGVTVVDMIDRTFQLHLGGKIELHNRVPVRTRDDLSMAYTPGVARVCQAIHAEPEKAFDYTIKRNTVAVVSDGSAVLGLGNIGPRAAMPVMEGKAMLFKEFAGVDAFPICLDTQDTDEIVRIVEALSPTFGGVNLEDIAAPRCFEIEERLQASLDIPVFHDDQHGTAVVVLAALLNALKLTGRSLEDLQIVVAGLGAAGVAVTKILMAAGARRIIGCDSRGALHLDRADVADGSASAVKRWYAAETNPERRSGAVRDVIDGADLFIGLSGPGVIDADDLDRMAADPIIFAMANPDPEIRPEEAAGRVRIMATGRSDYPNQINNVLAFPGIFRGALDVRARQITEPMKQAAARAIAGIVGDHELREDYIIPSVFNRDVVGAVAAAVAYEARQSGTAEPAGAGELGFAATEHVPAHSPAATR